MNNANVEALVSAKLAVERAIYAHKQTMRGTPEADTTNHAANAAARAYDAAWQKATDDEQAEAHRASKDRVKQIREGQSA